MSGHHRKVPEHPCEICKKPTTNPKTCSRVCGGKFTRREVGPQRGPRKRIAVNVRLFDYIPERPRDECWQWLGACDTRHQYPLIWCSERQSQVYAQRVSWEHYFGPIPKGHVVSQKCENFKCVNPKHLVCGPRGKIIGERNRRNRKGARYGEQNKSSKLTDREARAIRTLHRHKQFDVLREFAKRKGMAYEYLLSIGRGQRRRLPVAPSYVPGAHRSR